MSWLLEPWPWWLSGILVGLTVPLLHILAGKAFGISTSLQEIGALCSPHSKLDYFRSFDRKAGLWTLFFVVGIGIGGAVAVNALSSQPIEFLPGTYTGAAGVARLFGGGLLIGFGTRYAGGCTSGHAITGIANLSGPSLVATIFFFVGGLLVTWGLGNLIF